VNGNDVLVMAEAGAVTETCVAAPGFTVIDPLVPLIEDVTVSVAVIFRVPAVFRVAEKVPVPAVRLVSAGSVAAPSVLVKWTVPAYPGTILSLLSRAVTVNENAEPAVWGVVAETVKCVAVADWGAVTE
jgi:hypothetical protein